MSTSTITWILFIFLYVFKFAAATIELVARGVPLGGAVFNVTEGELLSLTLFSDGFSYGVIPVTVSLLTYSEYTDLGLNLTDAFDLDDIPEDEADGKHFLINPLLDVTLFIKTILLQLMISQHLRQCTV